MKKCETFGCNNAGIQMYQIAPATNVWLCQECIDAAVEATRRPEPKARDMRPAA